MFAAGYWSARSDIQSKLELTPGASNEYGRVVTRKDASGKDVTYFELKDLKREYMTSPDSASSDVNCSAVPAGTTGVYKLCADKKSMNGKIAPGIIFGVVGAGLIATGVIVLVTDKGPVRVSAAAKHPDKTLELTNVQVVPMFASGQNGVSVVGQF